MLALDNALFLWCDLQRKIASSIRNGADALLSIRLVHKATERLCDGRCWGAISDNALNGHGCRHSRRTTILHSRRTTITRALTPTTPTAPTPDHDHTEP